MMKETIILNPDALTPKAKLFTKNGKTTFRNLAYINSSRWVEQLQDDIGLLLPSELFKLIPSEDIEQYYFQSISDKHDRILTWMKEKHIFRDTGEIVRKDNYFVECFFSYKQTKNLMLSKLKNRKFDLLELNRFIETIERDDNIISVDDLENSRL